MVNFKLAAVLLLANSALTLAAKRNYTLQFFDSSECDNPIGDPISFRHKDCVNITGDVFPYAFTMSDNPKGLRCKSGYEPILDTYHGSGCDTLGYSPVNLVSSAGSACNHIMLPSDMPVKSVRWYCRPREGP